VPEKGDRNEFPPHQEAFNGVEGVQKTASTTKRSNGHGVDAALSDSGASEDDEPEE